MAPGAPEGALILRKGALGMVSVLLVVGLAVAGAYGGAYAYFVLAWQTGVGSDFYPGDYGFWLGMGAGTILGIVSGVAVIRWLWRRFAA